MGGDYPSLYYFGTMRYILVVLSFFLLAFSCEGNVVLILDKDEIDINESLCFSIINNSEEPIMLPNPNPWEILRNDEIVYAPITIQVLTELPSGKARAWCWNLKSNEGILVAPGEYTLLVNTGKLKLEKRFKINK